MPTAQTPSHRLPEQSIFLAKFKITPDEFRASGLRWRDLQTIFEDYSQWSAHLPPQGECLAAILRQCPEVHAAKSRAKKAENLIEKIIRRSIEEGRPWALPSNYVSVVPDLIGIRALYLLHGQWPVVNSFIRRTWNIRTRPKPVAYIQNPIPKQVRSAFIKGGCTVKSGKDGYQSVHYEMLHQAGVHNIRVEVQARTLYQEAWGEISHVTAYPYQKNIALVVNSMQSLAGLTTKADHFSSIVKQLSMIFDALKQQEEPNSQIIVEFLELLKFLQKYYPDDISPQLEQARSALSSAHQTSHLRIATNPT